MSSPGHSSPPILAHSFSKHSELLCTGAEPDVKEPLTSLTAGPVRGQSASNRGVMAGGALGPENMEHVLWGTEKGLLKGLPPKKWASYRGP